MVRPLTFRLFLLMLACLTLTGPVHSTPRDPRLAQVESFALALGVVLDEPTLALLGQYDLVVLDGVTASNDVIQTLQSAGAIVLGYLSVGTIERGRPWYRKVKPYRLDFWEDWGEWYADVSSARYRKILLGVLDELSSKGFDGMFLDNVDMVEVYPEMRSSMKRLVAQFSRRLRARSKLLFSQNGERFTVRIAPYLDGWNSEGVTSDYEFDTRRYRETSAEKLALRLLELDRVSSLGLLVTITNYALPDDIPARSSGCFFGCVHGFPAYTTDIELSTVPPRCECLLS